MVIYSYFYIFIFPVNEKFATFLSFYNNDAFIQYLLIGFLLHDDYLVSDMLIQAFSTKTYKERLIPQSHYSISDFFQSSESR